MGKRQDLAKQIADLQKEHDEAPDDDDDDLEIGVEKDGQKVTVRGRHARKVMRRLGLDDPESAPGGDGQGDEDGEDGEAGDAKKDPAPPAGHRYFRGKTA
jgi:hypothetical protein